MLAALCAYGAAPAWAQFVWDGTTSLAATALGGNTVANGATLAITTGNNHDFNASTITNNGTATWTAGYLRTGSGGTFINNGTFNDQNSGGYNFYNPFGGAGTFTNNGSYVRNTTGTTLMDVTFANAGTVNVQQGILDFRGAVSMTGGSSMTATKDTTVYFESDTISSSGATLGGAGNYILYAGTMTATGTLNAANLQQVGGNFAGTNTLVGHFTWSGGKWNNIGTTTIAVGSILDLNAQAETTRDFDARAIVNNGTVNWSAGYLRSGNGGSFTNASGATFNDLNASGYIIQNPYGGTFTFTNNGTYVRNAANATYFDVPFSNNGTLTLQQGDIEFRASGTLGSAGKMIAAKDTNVYFRTDYNIANGSSLTGAGTFWLTGGTFDVAGTLNVSNFNQTGGMLTNTNTLKSVYNWSGGNWNSASGTTPTTTIDATATLNLSDTSDTTRDFNARAIVNNGTVNWSAGYIRGGNGSTFTNATGATFNDLNAPSYTIQNPFGGTFAFTNNGTYVRHAAGTTFIDVTFNNNGAINLLQGDIEFRAGGTLSSGGTMAAAAGTNIFFRSDYTIASGSSLSGAGDYWLTGGLFTINGAVNLSRFNQTGGSLAGNNTINGTFNWSGGNWNASGSGPSTTIAAGGVLNLSDSSDNSRDFNSRLIVNNGTINWLSGYIRSGNGGSFVNNGTFSDQNAPGYTIQNPYGGAFYFINNGTYIRNAANTTYFDVPLNNNGTLTLQQGDIQIRQGGSMSASSVVNSTANTHLYFTNDYILADGAKFTGTGLVDQIAGALTINGRLTASSFLWSGGNWNATDASLPTTTIASSTVLNLTDSNDTTRDFNGRNIVNQGTVNWYSGFLRSGNGGSFTNAAGATFNDFNAPGYTINSAFGGTAIFTNNGTYIRNTTNSTFIDTTFNNNGTLTLQQGDIQFRQGGTMSATSTVNTSNGTHLYFTNDYILADGAKFTGTGLVDQIAGTLTINGRLTASSFLWSGGNWNATDASLPTTTIASSTVLNLTDSNDNTRDFNGRTIVNLGTVNWYSGFLRSGNCGSFTNAVDATFNDYNAPGYTVNSVYGGAVTFTNKGTYLKSTAGTSYFDVPFINGGTVSLVEGNLQFRAGGTFLAGSSITSSGSGTAQLINGTFKTTGATSGALTWLGGNFNGVGSTTFGPSLTLNIVGGADHDYDASALVNQGTVNWTEGRLRSGNGGSFTNAGTWNDSSNYSVNSEYGNAPATFINAAAGTYLKTAGTTTFLVSFTNAGTISVTGGIFNLAAGANFTDGSSITSSGNGVAEFTSGTFTGSGNFTGSLLWLGGNLSGTGTTTFVHGFTFNIAGGADHDFDARTLVNQGIVNWTGGRLRSGNGGSFTNAGTWNDSSNYSVNSEYGNATATFTNAAAGTYLKTAGTTTFLVPFTNAGTVNVTGGALNLAAGGNFASGTTLVSNGGAVQLIDGTFAISATSAGTLTWLGGNFSGTGNSTFGPGLTFNIAGGADHDFDARTLVNQGTVNWTDGRLRSGDGGSITNAGTWNDSTNYSVNSDFGNATATFTNAAGGTYNKTAGTSTFLVPFTNAGTVKVSGGALNLAAGGNFAGGTIVASNGGVVQLTGGTFTAAAASSGTLTWIYGNFSGTGNSTFGPGLTFNIAGGADHDFDARTLVNQGTVNWTEGRLRSGNGGSFTNSGIWNDSANYSVNSDFGNATATFTNAAGGTYNKTAGTSTFLVPFTNAGTVKVSAGALSFLSSFTNDNGTINAAGGSLSFSAPLDLGTGKLSGNGTITAPSVTAGGPVAPGNSPGLLTIHGDLTLLSTSLLQIELGGTTQGTGYDFLNVSSAAVLGGSQLQLAFVNNFQTTATSANTFTVLTASSLTGVFSNVSNGTRLLTTDGLGSFLVNYGTGSAFSPNSVVLSQFVPVPEPSTWALLLLGTATLTLVLRPRKR